MNEEKVDSCWMKMIFEIFNQNHQIITGKKDDKLNELNELNQK